MNAFDIVGECILAGLCLGWGAIEFANWRERRRARRIRDAKLVVVHESHRFRVGDVIGLWVSTGRNAPHEIVSVVGSASVSVLRLRGWRLAWFRIREAFREGLRGE